MGYFTLRKTCVNQSGKEIFTGDTEVRESLTKGTNVRSKIRTAEWGVWIVFF